MNKAVLITGAAGGIGSALARAFAAEGYRVALNYCRSESAAKALEQELVTGGMHAFAVKADVSDSLQVQAMVGAVEERFGGIDILINNAGVAQQKLFTDITEDDFSLMFDVHVKGCFYCSKAVLPAMLRRHNGVILNISSVWGVYGASCEVHYSAAKAAIIGLTKALAKEVAPSGIRVNAIAPGVIDTPMNGSLSDADALLLKDSTPVGRLGNAGDVAAAALFLADDKASFITGQVLGVDGGFCG